MAEIYLMHHRHGTKVASMEMEAQYDEMNGWVRYYPDELVEEFADETIKQIVEASVSDLPEPAVEANVMAEPRRRGRPRREQGE